MGISDALRARIETEYPDEGVRIRAEDIRDGFEVTADALDDLEAADTAINTSLALKANILVTPNTQTADYTLVLADVNKAVRMNSASDTTLTIPLNASVAFAVGTMLTVRGVGAGTVTIEGAVGVTVNAEDPIEISQYGSAVLHKVATNEWDVYAGSGSSLTQLATPTLTATMVSDTRIDLSWTNVANESSYRLEWSANGTSGWTQIGGTIAANTTTYSHTGLTAETQYFYRVKAVGDGTTYSDSAYGTDDATTDAAGGSRTPMTVDTSSQTSLVGDLHSGNSGINAYDGFIVFNESLGAGQDGRVWVPRLNVSECDFSIAFDVSATIHTALGNQEFGALDPTPGNGVIIAVTPTGDPTSLSIAVNEWLVIERIGSTIKIYRSADGVTLAGSEYTFAATSAAELFVHACLNGLNGEMQNPEIEYL